jgi:hypothetical protein
MEIRFSGKCGAMRAKTSPFFEIAPVLVRFDHVASFIVNANHSVVRSAAKLSFPLLDLLFVLCQWHRTAIDTRP